MSKYSTTIFWCLFTFQITLGTDKQASFEIDISLDFSVISGFIMISSSIRSDHFLFSFQKVIAIILIFLHNCGAASHTQSYSYISSIKVSANSKIS
ncbi:MAG: hypothetical protein BWY04_01409 [candidate division CPR1 bacterium ADurb.Bin160]|uniref:Uncharacterized protein n=1 Tax=candidate division CPR1 bacterium ADurb.Bin160 TaxID=1852826 RepID=A0A1V5ZJ40_9BACT|nr:MAG: hypothetical protein BWY04_01409 [candidate division CPR1 bacterium ADurb.Bin160]